jgi:Fe-S cluster assembly protein SufD
MAEPATLMQQPWGEELERLSTTRSEPDFVTRLRRSGLDRVQQLGLPHRKLESWRFTDLSDFTARHFARADSAVPVDASVLPEPLTEGARLVFVNGHYRHALSMLPAQADGITVGSLKEALARQPEWLESWLGRAPAQPDYVFGALNDALFEDGGFIHLAAGRRADQPIELLFYSTGDGVASYPRNLIVLEPTAELALIERHCGAGSYGSMPQTEILLDQGAVCRHHKLQQEAADGWHLGSLRLELARDSQLRAHGFNLGGRLNRTEIDARLDGEGADCGLHGLSLVEDGELADYHVRVEHARPHGTSRQRFKSVLNGKSRAVFDGLIKVIGQAQKTDASQDSRNLLLSRQALANTNPRLEILADDVKCAHGSTVGFLDPEAMFYLRSRGIDQSRARAMLVFAFANEQLEHLTLPALQDRLESLLMQRYYPDRA